MWPFRRSRRVPQPLGRTGERIARKSLKRRGLRILAQNYRCPVGEADLIALDASTRESLGAETLCFVEVKTRSSDRYTDPSSSVRSDKQRRLRKVAGYYLATHDAEDLNVRFDVVSIVAPRGDRARVEYIPNAF